MVYSLLAAIALTVLPTVLFRFIAPPVTSIGVFRSLEYWWTGKEVSQRTAWVPYSEISPNLVRAVVAAEDSRFVDHWGVDWQAVRAALSENWSGRRSIKGASTITMQTAKNLFLWPGRQYLRKGLEVYFAYLQTGLWSKRRTLEIYLNIVEWGTGVYGAEAAARHYFSKPASKLTASEASLLAAILPNPRRWSARNPTAYIKRRAAVIAKRAGQVAIPQKAGSGTEIPRRKSEELYQSGSS